MLLDIPKLMFKTPSAVDKALGKPSGVQEAMNRGAVTGEQRTYDVPGAGSDIHRGEVRVEFYRGKAVSFFLYLDTEGDCGKALRMVGIHHPDTRVCDRRRDENSFFERYVAETLNIAGTFEGVEFVNSRISPEHFRSGPNGVYQILLQGKSPVTVSPD